MKWYSVKKYVPATDYNKYIVRSATSHACLYEARYEVFPGKWINIENNEELKYVTHFAIIEPVEIEE